MNRPTKAAERTARQRNRILEAAQECFIRDGFHAASVASIAAAADMSPGLIYRYFDNKNAIILAIIERQLEDKKAIIATLKSDQDLATRLRDLFARWRRADPSVMNPALFLEISAQAGRDPQIASAVTDADRASNAALHGWLGEIARERGCNLSRRETRARTLLLQSFIEGLAIRAVRDPGFDAGVLAEALNLLLSSVLSFGTPEPVPGCGA
jgi:AcrR family transcriptional regulator